jgi:S1-C subfamily serine protease
MTKQKWLWFSCFSLAFNLNADAQVGKDSGLWVWTQEAIHHQAIVQVSTDDGCGTGVVIGVDKSKPIKDGYEGYCLTAWHIVQNVKDNSIKINYRSGRRAKGCRVVQKDIDRDIALVWAWVPADVTPAKLATDPIRGGDHLEFVGLGGGSDLQTNLRHFSGVASSPSSMEKIFADVALLPGDSGGPVFNAKQEVAGIISGGWFWYDGGVKLDNGSEIKATWPARASNIKPIRHLVANLDTGIYQH